METEGNTMRSVNSLAELPIDKNTFTNKVMKSWGKLGTTIKPETKNKRSSQRGMSLNRIQSEMLGPLVLF